MSDAADDQTGTSAQGAGSTNEQLGAWQQPASQAGWSEIEAEAEAAAGRAPTTSEQGSQSAAEAERQRRPSSLRGPVEGEVPRRRLTPPPFPRTTEPDPGPEAGSADAEPVSAADFAAAPNPGPSPVEKLVALVNERPEVGLGIAFLGGLILATILKRLAR